MITYAQVVDKKGQPYIGVWLSDDSKKLNDVHLYVLNYSGKDGDDVIVLGHNTQDLNKIGGTPLAITLENNGINLQYKCSETGVDIVGVDPEVFSRLYLTFLKAVRDEALAKPYKAPEKAVELKE